MDQAAQLLPYMSSVIGFLIVYVLNGIKTEIKDVKETMHSLEQELRGALSGLEHRITKVESYCSLCHAE